MCGISLTPIWLQVFFDSRDLCIVDIDVTVTLRHPCTRQIELVLFGPGPNSHDANYEPSARSHTVQVKCFLIIAVQVYCLSAFADSAASARHFSSSITMTAPVEDVGGD